MFNKIKGFFKNIVNNIKYVCKGIKKLFSKAKDDIDRIAIGDEPDMDSLEITVNAAVIASSVCAVLLASKALLSPVAFCLISSITAVVVELVIVRGLIVYGAKEETNAE